MNYILFLIFLLGSFAMAGEGSLGIVRIENTQPVKYDSATGKVIPDSQNTILEIEGISYNEDEPGEIALISAQGDRYDALMVTFDNKNNLDPKKFEEYLQKNKGFQINVNQNDLEFDSSTFLSLLKVEAQNIEWQSNGL